MQVGGLSPSLYQPTASVFPAQPIIPSPRVPTPGFDCSPYDRRGLKNKRGCNIFSLILMAKMIGTFILFRPNRQPEFSTQTPAMPNIRISDDAILNDIHQEFLTNDFLRP